MFMTIIALWLSSLRNWAFEETNTVKRMIKIFIAGFVDGLEYGCLVIGNIICSVALIICIINKCRKRTDET